MTFLSRGACLKDIALYTLIFIRDVLIPWFADTFNTSTYSEIIYL